MVTLLLTETCWYNAAIIEGKFIDPSKVVLDLDIFWDLFGNIWYFRHLSRLFVSFGDYSGYVNGIFNIDYTPRV